MARKQVELKYITNESARKSTFIKRKKGLIKKITELSILCDVPACLVMYSEYETNPVVWPNGLEARRIIAEYKNMPEIEQSKRMVNQETFLKEHIAKLKEKLRKLRKLRKGNDEKELSLDMFQCLVGRPLQGLSVVGMSNMRALLERYERDINAKLNRMGDGVTQGNMQAPPPAPAVVPPASVVTGGDPIMKANVH